MEAGLTDTKHGRLDNNFSFIKIGIGEVNNNTALMKHHIWQPCQQESELDLIVAACASIPSFRR
jgi:peptidyl-tRNA hydrolase